MALVLAACGRIAFDPTGGNPATGDALVGDGGTVGQVISTSPLGIGGADLRGLGVAPDGSAAVLLRVSTTLDLGNGMMFTNTGRGDMVIVALDAAGAVRWGRQFVDTFAPMGILVDGQQALAVDNEGNITIAGEFAQTVDFGTGPKTSAGADDIAVVSVSKDNVVRWVKTFGNTLSESVSGIGVDANDGVFVAGDFAGTVDFGGGPVTAAGMGDVFVVHYAQDGTFTAAAKLGGAGDDVLTDVSIGADISMCGFFSGTSDFGKGAITSAGSFDGFTTTYSLAGVAQAQSGFGGTADDVLWGIAHVGSLFAAAGTFSATITTPGGMITSAGGRDAIVGVGPGPQGPPSWFWHGGDTGDDEVYDVAVDAAGNVYITGFFAGTIMFDRPITSAGGRDGFVASFQPDGTLRWVRTWGTAGTDEGRRVVVRADGSVALGGIVGGTFDFDGHTIGGTSPTNFVLVLR